MVSFLPGSTNTTGGTRPVGNNQAFRNPVKPKFVPQPTFKDTTGFKAGGAFQQGIFENADQYKIDAMGMSPADIAAAAQKNFLNPKTGKVIANYDANGNIVYIDPKKAKGALGTFGPQISTGLALGGTKEAQDFQFDLPETGFSQAQSGLFDLSNQLIGGMGAGQMDRESAQQELSKLQRMALSPVEGMSAAERQQYQDMADQRRAELEQRFTPGTGDIANLFARQGASDIASLANRGVLDSTTGAQSMARRDTDLAAMYQQLLGGANEQSRQDLIGAQGRLADTATQFGGLQGGQATASGQLGQGYGQLGLSGLSAAGDLGLRNQEQQGQFQLAETGQRLLGNQLQLQNIQSLLNSVLNRKLTKQQAAMQQELFDKYMNPGFDLLGATAGLFGGTGIGNFLEGGRS